MRMRRKKVLLGQELHWTSRDNEKHNASVAFANGWKLSLVHYTRFKEPADTFVGVTTYAPNGEKAFFFGTFTFDDIPYATHDEIQLPWEALSAYAQWVSSFDRKRAYLSAYNAIQRIADELAMMRKENAHAEA